VSCNDVSKSPAEFDAVRHGHSELRVMRVEKHVQFDAPLKWRERLEYIIRFCWGAVYHSMGIPRLNSIQRTRKALDGCVSTSSTSILLSSPSFRQSLWKHTRKRHSYYSVVLFADVHARDISYREGFIKHNLETLPGILLPGSYHPSI
jgi:hypothetical protein